LRVDRPRSGCIGVFVAALFVLLIFAVPGESASALWSVRAQSELPTYIDEYRVPTRDSAPLAITVDSNGKVWFTESNASKLAKFDPVSKNFTEYKVPWVGDMWGVVADPRGYIWFTQYSGKGSVNPGGAIVQGGTGRIAHFDIASRNFTSIPIFTNSSFPMRLTMDQRGRIWFTEFLGNKIGLFDPTSNRLQEYPIPTNSSGATDLTFDNHGDLWFSESYARQLGEFNPQNEKFMEYPLGAETHSQIVSSPVGLAVDMRGNLWVADHGGNWIVKFNPQTRMTVKYPTHFPPEDVYPISLVNDLLIDSRGYVWFAEHGGNSIGYYDPESRSMIEFPIPTGPMSTALWMALAPNGDVWFTEWSGNNIGVVYSHGLPPVVLSTPFSSLTLSQGQQMTVPVQIKNLQDLQGNGTSLYAWGSYNPRDVSGTFSPQYPSLAGSTQVTAQLTVSRATEPGNYTLALGVRTQNAIVLTMISVEVLSANNATRIPLLNIAVLGGVVVLAVVTLVLVRRNRSRREHV
jgi:virginiamycin B lyase